MGKSKRKRTINRKAGSHDLSYATTEPQVGRFLHSDVAYKDWRCCSVYECKRDLVRIRNIDHYKGLHSIHTGKVDSSERVVSFSLGL